MNNMLVIEEVEKFLGVERTGIEKFIKDGHLHAYKIGGVYVRFRKEEVLHLKYDVLSKNVKTNTKISFWQRLWGFWRFNNFYILSIIIIAALIYWFLQTAAS